MSRLIVPQSNDAGIAWQAGNIRGDRYWASVSNSTYLLTSVQNAGSYHSLFASENASTWRNSLNILNFSPANQYVTSMSWNGSVFVAVSYTGAIRTSSDTRTWTSRTSGTTNPLRHVVSPSASINIAVGNAGTIVTSTTTGTSWVVRTSGTTNNLLGVASGASNAVAVGDGGVILLNTLSNGTGTWSSVTSPTTNSLNSIVWAQSQYITVGANGVIFRSPDGTNWYSVTSPTTNSLNYVIWTGSLYLAVGDAGTILTSPDGITWTSRVSGTTTALYSCTVFSSKLYVFGGPPGIALQSTDGITWTSANNTPIGITTNYTGIVKYSGTYVATTNAGDILTTTDLVNWSKQNTGVTGIQLSDITRAGSKFIAVGYPKTILTSTDAITWTQVSNPGDATATFNKVGYNPVTGTILVGTSNYKVLRSTDNGVTWSIQTLSGFGNCTSIFWTGTELYLSFAGGQLYKSINDGVSWTSVTTTSSPSFGSAGIESMTYGNGVFIVHTYLDGIYSSTDGLAYTYRTGYAAVGSANTVLWTGTQFIVGTLQGKTIYVSKDGITWTSKSTGMYGQMSAIAGDDSTLVALGASTSIVTSPPISLTL